MVTAPLYMVVAVNGVGVLGEVFSCGVLVLEPDGTEVWSGSAVCSPRHARGRVEDFYWVDVHVEPHLPKDHDRVATPTNVREWFWKAWTEWRERGATLAVESVYPHFGAFLNQGFMEDYRRGAENFAPPAVLDINSLCLGQGINPFQGISRQKDETPAHEPIADARFAARKLLMVADKAKTKLTAVKPGELRRTTYIQTTPDASRYPHIRKRRSRHKKENNG